jgi:glycosyltransferase involved in cell wall biosynthesis
MFAMMPQIKPRPKLSLCISTYNRAKWLRVSLENIFRQLPDARDDLEVLVVDNCSVDNTPEVARQFAHRTDFRYVRNPANVGMLGNLAVTAQRARGEYVWILGDDDLTRKRVIEDILSLLSNHPQLELVYMNYGYTSEPTPDQVEDLDKFLDEFNVLQPSCPDELGTVVNIAAKTENFYTAIYSHVYRRDHAMRAYCQDTSGRIFSTMRACIPTAYYVLHNMADAPAYWIGEQALVVNSNVSWADYGALLDLEHLPAAWDLAERMGCPAEQVDMRRANRLWLVEMMWRDMFENDKAGNSSYISARRVIMRLRHLPEFEKHVTEFRRIYTVAHKAGNPAAALAPSILFGAF